MKFRLARWGGCAVAWGLLSACASLPPPISIEPQQPVAYLTIHPKNMNVVLSACINQTLWHLGDFPSQSDMGVANKKRSQQLKLPANESITLIFNGSLKGRRCKQLLTFSTINNAEYEASLKASWNKQFCIVEAFQILEHARIPVQQQTTPLKECNL